MKKIISLLTEHKKELILGPLFKLFEAILELFVPLVTASIIDVGILQGDRSYVISRGLLMLGLGALGVVAGMICQYYAARMAGDFGRDLRNDSFRHVLKLSGGDVAAFGSGGLITRLTNDMNQMQTGINMAIRLGTRVPFLAIGSIVMAMRLNLRIGLVFLLCTPLIVLVLYVIMRKTLPSFAAIQGEQDKLSRLSVESLSGVRIIRAFSRQKEEAAQYEETAQDLTTLMVRVGRISVALNPLTSVIANAAIVAIVWLGSNFVFQGSMLSGEIIALVNYMNQSLLALIVAANIIVVFTRALASAQRVAKVLDTQPTITAPETGEAPTPEANASAVSFDHVRFAYHEGSEDALEDISFSFVQGQTVGLIGGTGSGKSTLVNLLMRYYDVGSGAVCMDGVDVREMPPSVLRRQIGLAPQKAVLFAGSVRHNLRLSAPEATDEEIWHALTMAQAADFVRQMPGGLDTIIEEGGKNLSGGQRQRLTIARAVIRTPRLLILDDSASALDYATDAALRAALGAEKRTHPDMSVLLISQRAASLMGADTILVLDDGQLVGQGTHAELLRGNEVYREICLSQGLSVEVAS